LAKVLTVSWQSLEPLASLHMHGVTELCVLGGPVLWMAGGLRGTSASAGNACGVAALLHGLLSVRKSQAGCLYWQKAQG